MYLQKGSGVIAIDRNGKRVTVGNRELFNEKQLEGIEKQIEALESNGKTVLIVGIGKQLAGIIALADVLKKDSKKAIKAFKNSGIDVWLITGDTERVANAVASQLGITNVIAQAKPTDKADKIKELQR
ncbi:MAG: HAD-IC family P-type ATPase, partial [Candidatus Micrarchaeaceae archaeon]